jgi:hypothetical protein
MTDFKSSVNGYPDPGLSGALTDNTTDSAILPPLLSTNLNMNESHELPQASASQKEAIAIIGMSGRFPQDAVSVEKFWQMIMEGRSARSEVPKDRYNVDAFYAAPGDNKTGMV